PGGTTTPLSPKRERGMPLTSLAGASGSKSLNRFGPLMSWQHVRGHDELIAAFGRAVARGRLAHAYLFVGPPGVGKRHFARQLAKTLLCESPPAGRWDSCDACAACTLVDAGTHPDLFAVARPDDKLEMPIEVIRDLCYGLALKPARGGRKIALVDD